VKADNLRCLVSTSQINEIAAVMAIASELVQVAPSSFIWQAYDSAVKADLFSSAVVTATGIFLIDPIPMEENPFSQLREQGPIIGIVVTNSNHHRASAQVAERFSAPIFAHRDTFSGKPPHHFRKVADGDQICDELRVIDIEGAAAGEIVLYCFSDGGALIVGDALINFEPYGFTFLPGKYCSNHKKMHRSLRTLLAYKVKRMLFAHGLPILFKASDRLRQLLDSDL
jgi:glyoxylase-like metal-dependent hydrolase (beta-lactamase superfamily II)